MLRWLVVALAFVAGSISIASSVSQSTQSAAPGEADTVGPVQSSWGKKLNPTSAIPSKGFRAFYFDRRNPSKVVFQEDVNGIAIKYAWADFHAIESPNFAAYWVGKLNFQSAATRQFSVSQSWAKSRIFIDGAIVFDESSRKNTFRHHFTPGDHVVEVEYINNWHTVEYKVTIGDVIEKLDEETLASRLQSQDGKFGGVYYVGLYESARKDTSVDVTVPETDSPVILWLSSYEAIEWNVDSLKPGSVVVVSSHAPGSQVSGSHVGQVFHSQSFLGRTGLSKRCSCTAGHFRCEERTDMNDLAEKLLSTIGVPLTGYAAEYSAAAVTIQPYDRALALRISQQRAKEEAAEKLCVKKANPDFDTMMDEAQ